MPISFTGHEEYTKYQKRWEKMEHTYEGAEKVKEEGTTYLPKTKVQIGDGEVGDEDYTQYKFRADFPGLVSESVRHFHGILHEKVDSIKLPEELMPIIEFASPAGETLQGVMRQISFYQLLYGRCGIYAYYPEGRDLPVFRIYPAPSIVTWNYAGTDNDTIAIKEDVPVFDPENLLYTPKEQLRVLRLINGRFVIEIRDSNGRQAQQITPLVLDRNVNEIPFTFCNTNDISREVSSPPLIEVADLAVLLYNKSADLNTIQHQQGFSTFVVRDGSGDDGDFDDENTTPEERLAIQQAGKLTMGPNSYLEVPPEGGAGWESPSFDGVEMQIKQMENLFKRAKELGGRLDQPETRQIQSGEALQFRQSASNVTLNSLAQTRQEAMIDIFKKIARGRGISEDEIRENLIIETNKDFTTNEIRISNLRELLTMHLENPDKIPYAVVAEYMKRYDVTGYSQDELLEIARKELESGISRLPVVNNQENNSSTQ